MRSVSEDYASETLQGESEVDTADRRHRDELRPHDRDIGTAIQNSLREGNEDVSIPQLRQPTCGCGEAAPGSPLTAGEFNDEIDLHQCSSFVVR